MSVFLPSPETCAALWHEVMLQEDNDRLWTYFVVTIDFFAALEARDRVAARAAEERLLELAAEIMEARIAV